MEAYCFRILLQYVPGATCHTDMKKYKEVEYETFQEAAFARGLIDDDEEWERCMEEANHSFMDGELIRLFVALLLNCTVAEPRKLFDKYIDTFCSAAYHMGTDNESIL